MHGLISNLNKLIDELDECQDHFHCKGGNDSNAVLEIYRGFCQIIGQEAIRSQPTIFGNTTGRVSSGLTAIDNYCAQIVNTCYSEALDDKICLENSIQQ